MPRVPHSNQMLGTFLLNGAIRPGTELNAKKLAMPTSCQRIGNDVATALPMSAW